MMNNSNEMYELENELFKKLEKAKGFKKLAIIMEIQGLMSMSSGK